MASFTETKSKYIGECTSEGAMNKQEYDYHYENLLNMDPDEIVGELELTSEDILNAFEWRVEQFIKDNYG